MAFIMICAAGSMETVLFGKYAWVAGFTGQFGNGVLLTAEPAPGQTSEKFPLRSPTEGSWLLKVEPGTRFLRHSSDQKKKVLSFLGKRCGMNTGPPRV